MSFFDHLTRFKTEVAIAWLVTLFLNFIIEPQTIAKITAPVERLFSSLLNQLRKVFCGNYKGW